jgi:UDP-3-O-[3-hydroxymyristoyl] N-acetylglucosamine deacetylase
VVDGDVVMNEDGLRYADEFARHKALDAVGDLALAGAPIKGRYVGVQGGHALNVALVKALLARPRAWRWSVEPVALEMLPAAGV